MLLQTFAESKLVVSVFFLNADAVNTLHKWGSDLIPLVLALIFQFEQLQVVAVSLLQAGDEAAPPLMLAVCCHPKLGPREWGRP